MKAFDFEYDNLSLSSFGYMICDFDSKGKEVVSNGSQITFVNATISNGTKNEPTGIKYDSFLETTFSICKNPCRESNMVMTMDEVRILSKWLNRKENLKFKLLSDEYQRIYFEGSFNIKMVKFNGEVYGLELTFKANRPYALLEERTFLIKNKEGNTFHTVHDMSDVEGFIYPKMKITIDQDGDLIILNNAEQNDEDKILNGGRITTIKNCVAGEVITMDYPIIQSSNTSHAIQNDFNWNFFRIANTFRNNINGITISLPCTMEIKYSPIVKVGL